MFPDVIHEEKLNITLVAFLPKISNMNLSMRKYQPNAHGGTVYKITCPVFFNTDFSNLKHKEKNLVQIKED